MGGIADFFTGSSPSVQAAPPPVQVPTISPAQQGVQQYLSQLLLGGGGRGAYTGQMSVPLSPLQNQAEGAFAGLGGLVGGATQSAAGTVPAANQAIQSILQQGSSADIFKKSVIDPLEQSFQDTTLPGIASMFGANAGRGSDYGNVVEKATRDLKTSEIGAGAQFALQNEGNILGAASQAPGFATLPGQIAGQQLTAGAVPQQTQMYNQQQGFTNFLNQNQQQQNWIQQMLSLAGTPTIAPMQNAVVNPGQQGFLSALSPGIGAGLGFGLAGLLSPAAPNYALAGLGTPFSSREYKHKRKKADTKKILKVVEKLPVERWKYKWDDTEHIGPMAETFADLLGLEKQPRNIIHPLDAFGTALASIQELAKRTSRLEKKAA